MVANRRLSEHTFLQPMLNDGYFPNPLVAKCQAVLRELCERIESERPADDAAVLELTHAATEAFNELQQEFWDAGSEIETGAREAIAEEFALILEVYELDIDIEDAIAPRDW